MPLNRLLPYIGSGGNTAHPALPDVLRGVGLDSGQPRVVGADTRTERAVGAGRGSRLALDIAVLVGSRDELAGQLTAQRARRLGHDHRHPPALKGFSRRDPTDPTADDEHVAGRPGVAGERLGRDDSQTLNIENASRRIDRGRVEEGRVGRRGSRGGSEVYHEQNYQTGTAKRHDRGQLSLARNP